MSDDEAKAAMRVGHHFEPEESGSRFVYHGAAYYGLAQHMFYRQAAFFIGHLHARDPAAFGHLIARVVQRERLSRAFADSYGTGLTQLWDDYLASLNP